LAAFVVIAGLVIAALGWVTASALQLEREQHQARAEAERADRMRLALWRLDSRVSPLLAREDSRPYNHYSALYAPSLTLQNDGKPWESGDVLELSPLIDAELPDWMLLHFQTGDFSGWGSPQVPFPALERKFKSTLSKVSRRNVTTDRVKLLKDLSSRLPPNELVQTVRPHESGRPATQDTALVMAQVNWTAGVTNNENVQPDARTRFGQQQKTQQEFNPEQKDNAEAAGYNLRQGKDWFGKGRLMHPGAEVAVRLNSMVPVWVTLASGRELLLWVRLVQIEGEQICQGVVLDDRRLCALLVEEIRDLFPHATLIPIHSAVAPHPERAMATLPFQLESGEDPVDAPVPTWTPLRIGLGLTWLAALVALGAVGLGGWSLVDLSERRFRFVSAVTHELRTPLTTLRLYLDMLIGGMVSDEKQKTEYLHTLHQEADRLSRLVSNVLDYARLERHQPRLVRLRQPVTALVDQIQATWQTRCDTAGKKLLVENLVPDGSELETDGELVQQVIGNLLDNACKYSRSAVDPRLWLRVQSENDRLRIEVEDCGPGVPVGEQGSIFRPFQRGRDADVTAGGVGLGLALATRWTTLLGGKLTLRTTGPGACFCLELTLLKCADANGKPVTR